MKTIRSQAGELNCRMSDTTVRVVDLVGECQLSSGNDLGVLSRLDHSFHSAAVIGIEYTSPGPCFGIIAVNGGGVFAEPDVAISG